MQSNFVLVLHMMLWKTMQGVWYDPAGPVYEEEEEEEDHIVSVFLQCTPTNTHATSTNRLSRIKKVRSRDGVLLSINHQCQYFFPRLSYVCFVTSHIQDSRVCAKFCELEIQFRVCHPKWDRRFRWEHVAEWHSIQKSNSSGWWMDTYISLINAQFWLNCPSLRGGK